MTSFEVQVFCSWIVWGFVPVGKGLSSSRNEIDTECPQRAKSCVIINSRLYYITQCIYIHIRSCVYIYIYYHYSIKFPQIFKSTYDLKFSTKTRATKICHNLTRKSLLSQSAFPKLCRRMPILIEVVPVNPRKTGQDDSKNCMTGTSFIETPRCFFSIPWQKIATDH